MGCAAKKMGNVEDYQKYADMIQHGRMLIVSKSTCPYCDRAKQELDRLKVRYEVVEVDKSKDYGSNCKQLFEKASGIATFPKIFVGKNSIGGYDSLIAARDDKSLFTMLDE